jgi:hypothetical protein
MIEERVELLRRYIPRLWERPGDMLYVGSAPGRFQCGPELARAGHRITLLEIWPEYAAAYEDHPDVAQVIVGDVREPPLGDYYDVAFWWHGPEHVERAEVQPALHRLEALADLVVVGCPWGEYPQAEVDGNPHQVHRCALYAEDFRRWGYRVVSFGERDKRGQGWVIAWREAEQRLPEVIACVIAFNEEEMLPGCLESLQGQVSRIVVVDGAYAQFPHIEPVSTDATRAIALAYGAQWVDPPEDGEGYPMAWPDQVVKRSAYFVGSEGDWYLWIDADERLVGCLPVPEDGQHYALQINTRDGRVSWVPRLFQHRGRMRYEGSHNAVWSDDRLVHLAGATYVEPEQCRFVHLSHLRDEERQIAKRSYYAWQKPAERPYRRSHGI